MPIDSTADLLFKIGANSDDAEANMQRFRALFSKDLDGIKGDFTDWAKDMFGSLATPAGIATAAGATLATALVGIGAAAVDAAEKYAHLVEQVDEGSVKTGISAEQMSELKHAADITGVSYDSLVRGLTMFEAATVKAGEGAQLQERAFSRLGITSAQLKAGQQDIVPLLETVMDRMQGLASGTERASVARDLFGRGGTEMMEFLRLGSTGLKQMAADARDLGIIITEKDIVAEKEHRAALLEMKNELSAMAVEVGRDVLPMLKEFSVLVIGLVSTVKEGGMASGHFLASWLSNAALADATITKLVDSMGKMGQLRLGPADDGGAASKKVLDNYQGLSDVLEQVRGKMAGTVDEESKAAAEVDQLAAQVQKAIAALKDKFNKGDISLVNYKQQLSDGEELARLLPQLYQRMLDQIAEKKRNAATEATEQLRVQLASQQDQTVEAQEASWNEQMEKLTAQYVEQKHLTQENEDLIAAIRKAGLDKIRRDAQQAGDAATADLEQRLQGQQARTLEGEQRAWNQEMDALRADYAKKHKLTQENEDLIAALRKAGLDKIARDQAAAFSQEMARLQAQLTRVQADQMTSEQRIEASYADDVAKFSAAEQKKALAAATSDAQRAQIAQQYAAIRAGLLTKEQQDLQALRNSQGWQGVLGSPFAAMIKGDEALWKEWASSANQSHMMVRASLEGLKEVGQQTFQQFAQAMGQNIADAIVYQKSIGDAMRSALASTLESLAGQAITYAIYATALGFLRLAQYDPAGAASAFTSAAIWGSVGAAAAVAGRAIAPAQAGSTASGTAAGSASSAAATDTSTAAAATQQPQQHVTVVVQGHLVGWTHLGEFAAAMNDAVLNKDVTLTATNTKNTVTVTR
jgi:hypothetical protein